MPEIIPLNRFSHIPTDPLRNFKFVAEFTPAHGTVTSYNKSITTFKSGFQTINGLNQSVQSIPYREGGMNTTIHQVPGMATFTPITFQRGAVFGNIESVTWMKGLFAAAAGEGIGIDKEAGNDFRVNVSIYVLDHPVTNEADNADLITKQGKLAFKVWNAWITNLSYSDLNAGNQGLLFESMTLVHEGLSIANDAGTKALLGL